MEAEAPVDLPSSLMSTSSTVYDEPPVYGIHWPPAGSAAGTAPPSTIAPIVSLRHIEKTSGALVPCRNQSKSVGPYDRPIDQPVMPSATCVLNIPLSYVWQPNDASTPMRAPSLFPNQNLSRDMCPLIVEPSVYETPYAHALPSHERQCIPGGGFEHATFWFVELCDSE